MQRARRVKGSPILASATTVPQNLIFHESRGLTRMPPICLLPDRGSFPQTAPLAEFEHLTLTLQPVRVLNILGSETNGVQNCTASKIGHEANCVLGLPALPYTQWGR